MKNTEDYFPLIDATLRKLEKRSSKAFGLELDSLRIGVYYNLSSARILGMFIVKEGVAIFRFNKKVILKAGEKKYLEVVIHEFAHLVVHRLYKNAEPHGKEWKSVMDILGAKEASYTTSLLSKYVEIAYASKLKKIKCKCLDGIYTTGIRKANNIINRKAKCSNCGSKFKEI